MPKYFIAVLVGIILVGAGCSSKKEEQPAAAAQNQGRQSGAEQGRFVFSDNFTDASIGHVVVGETVVVMGAQGSDGSITAERIIIGNPGDNFAAFGRGARPEGVAPPDGPDSPPRVFQRPEGAPEIDSSRLQNMSEEERAALRGQFQGGQGGFGGRAAVGGSSFVQASGEVIKKDEESMVLKLNDGGSKLVFFSDATVVSKVNEPSE